MTEEPILLICASATVSLAAPGTVFDKKCSRCGKNVAMAPSGQRFLSKHPEAVILCHHCLKPEDIDGKPQSAASPEELRQEIAGAQPNTWKDRN